MRMGASGCVGAQGARGTQKTRQEGAFMVSKEGIWMLWPGKFPRTSCVGKIRKSMYESLKMGVHGRVWVGASKYKQRGAKTSQKEEQLRDQDMFSRAITLQNIYRTLVLQNKPSR